MAVPGRGGVFAGSGYSLYALQAAGRLMAEPGGTLLMAIGTERDSLSSLLSYKLDLRGPSVTVQTFCSTSLVSVHLAVQSLLNYECEFALAGGSFIPLGQGVGSPTTKGTSSPLTAWCARSTPTPAAASWEAGWPWSC